MSVVSLPVANDPRASGPGRRASTVALMRVDATLRAAVPPEDRPRAEQALTAERYELPIGQWDPADLTISARPAFAWLLLEGVVVREVLLAGRASAGLLGPGDVFRPWNAADTALPCSTRWTTGASAAIAVLDERFLAAARWWPNLMSAVYSRLNDQLDNAARRTAVCGLPRVEDRVLALFWQLADAWGVVRPEGIVVRLGLTHQFIGRLVAAKRPTVSLALSALAADGHLTRDGAGAWLLAHASRRVLEREIGGQTGTVMGFAPPD